MGGNEPTGAARVRVSSGARGLNEWPRVEFRVRGRDAVADGVRRRGAGAAGVLPFGFAGQPVAVGGVEAERGVETGDVGVRVVPRHGNDGQGSAPPVFIVGTRERRAGAERRVPFVEGDGEFSERERALDDDVVGGMFVIVGARVAFGGAHAEATRRDRSHLRFRRRHVASPESVSLASRVRAQSR